MRYFAENSSIHGIKYIFESEQARHFRLTWIIALTLSICGFLYYIHVSYLKWQLDPETILRLQERNLSDFPGPAVTICPNVFARDNSASIYKIFSKLVEGGSPELTREQCEVLAANVEWCNAAFIEVVLLLCSKYDLSDLNIIEKLDESSLNVTEFFSLCNEVCLDKVFKIFTNGGVCYVHNSLSSSMIFNTELIHDDFKNLIPKFNDTQPLWTPEGGYLNSTLNFPIRAKDYFAVFYPLLNEIDKENVCNYQYFRVYLHKPNEILTPFHKPIILNYNELIEMDLSIQSRRTNEALKGFPLEARKCYFEGEKSLKFFRTYTKTLCDWECDTNCTLEQCGCVRFSMPRDNMTRICNISEVVCTFERALASCDCLDACDDVRYIYEINRTPYHKSFHVGGVPERWALSTLRISIKETEIVDEIEKHLSYKLQNFISDFGGLLGLFMGCSLLSIIEILYFIIIGTKSLIRKEKVDSKDCAQKNDPLNCIVDIEKKVSLNTSDLNELRIKISELENEIRKNDQNQDQNDSYGSILTLNSLF